MKFLTVDALNELNIQGKKLKVSSFLLLHDNNEFEIRMEANCDNMEFCCIFHNASFIKLSAVNSDFDIVGFEIIDNSLRGWERVKRFYVNDYEEDTISFYCESFEISNIQEA